MKNPWLNEKEEFKKIQFVIDHFDFVKTQKVMKALNWTWHDDTEAPTIDHMKKMALDLLTDVATIEDSIEISSGGFTAERKIDDQEVWFRLTFCIEESDSAYYDED